MLSVDDILQPENVSYTDNVWTWAVAHMLHNGEDWQITTITDTAPIEIVFLSKGEPLTDYLISGNTVQNGTPSPGAPVDVVGCGERTGNLLYLYKSGYRYDNSGAEVQTASANIYAFNVESENTYTINSIYDTSVGVSTLRIFGLKQGIITTIIAITNVNELPYTYSVSNDIDEIRLSMSTGATSVMCNLGSITLPYEPYGYKLPLTIGGTEYPIYLGESQTTRQIKKLVLTGEEEWSRAYNGDNRFFYTLISGSDVPLLSTHFTRQDIGSTTTIIGLRIASNNLRIRPENVSTMDVSGFKNWLIAQYAAGTPVTVWYILAEPETGIVNEPLHKIGDYADTISMTQAGVTIPTAAGANTLTIDTAVQPSNVSITGQIKPVTA